MKTPSTALPKPEAALVAQYSPNLAWGKQIVEVTLMQWAYKASFNVSIGGNCHGLDVLVSAIGALYESLDRERGGALVELHDEQGDCLQCEDEDERGAEWLARMVVAIRIVDYIPPTVNEVRRLNGARPIADGDRPYLVD